MGAKYIFRLDDIAENMKWDNFFFAKRDIYKTQYKANYWCYT